MMISLKKFKILRDFRNLFIANESNRQISLDSKRVFYVCRMQKEASIGIFYKIKQFLMDIKDSHKITFDNRKIKETFDLSEQNLAFFQYVLIWETKYDTNDYITDYHKFLGVITQ